MRKCVAEKLKMDATVELESSIKCNTCLAWGEEEPTKSQPISISYVVVNIIDDLSCFTYF